MKTTPSELDAMNRAQLGALYEQLIGYNPFTDSPSITDAEVRETLKDYIKEADAAQRQPDDTPRQIAFMALKIAEANEREASSKLSSAEGNFANAQRRLEKARAAFCCAKLQTGLRKAELEKLPEA